jgi:hypothetical protein
MLYDDGPNDIITVRNADSVSMAFGSAVSFKLSSPATDQDVILPATSTANAAGIVVHMANYSRTFTLPDGTVAGDLDSTGLVVGTQMSILRRGRIWVQVRQAVLVGDPMFICYSPDGTVYTVKGQLGNADVSSTAENFAKVGTYITSAPALGFAVVDVAFVNKQ